MIATAAERKAAIAMAVTPVPRRPAAKLPGHVAGSDGSRGEACIGPLEVEREDGEHGSRKKRGNDEKVPAGAAMQPAQPRGSGGKEGRRHFDLPDKLLEEGRVLAVPAEEGLRLQGPPEGHEDRSLGEECPR